jgi:hypothetical protein
VSLQKNRHRNGARTKNEKHAPQAQRGAAARRAAPQAWCRASQRPFSCTSFWHYFHFPVQTHLARIGVALRGDA